MALIGKIIAVTGNVSLLSNNGDKRDLRLGDEIQSADTIQTLKGAEVELQLANGRVIHIGAEQLVAFDDVMVDVLVPDASDSAIDVATIDTVVKAVEEGKDINEVLEETAAGVGGNSSYGFGFVDLLRINDDLNNFRFAYEYDVSDRVEIEPTIIYNNNNDVVGGVVTGTPTISTVEAFTPGTADDNVNEGSNLVFNVGISGTSTTPVSYSLVLADVTATGGVDYNNVLTNASFSNGVTYNAGTGLITVPAGVTSFAVTVPTLTDTLSGEPIETLTLTIGGVTGSGGIIDTTGTPTISAITPATAVEGTNLVHTVTLSNASTTATSFAYSLTGTTATAGLDFSTTPTFSNGVTLVAGNLIVPAGVTSFTISIPTLDDALNEASETTSLSVGGVTAVGTITDNDAQPSLSINDVSVNEVAGTATFTVSLSAASGQTVTVGYNTSNGTATAGSDYTAVSGTLTFAPGTTTQTITVPITNDTLAESSETFQVNLLGAMNATISDNLGVGTIIDNDQPPALDLDADNSTLTGANYLTSYTENGVGVSIADSDIVISDVDSVTLASATITLTNAQSGDVLAVGALPSGITATVTGNVVTLSGNSTLANYQSAIRAVTFSSTSENPNTTPRTIAVVVNDGQSNSNIATTTINVVAVNDAPVGVGDSTSAVEGTTTLKASVLANDGDVEGSALTVSLFATNTSGTSTQTANGSNTVTTALGGTVVMNADGTYTYTAPARNHSDATPDVDSFAYKASDGSLNSNWTVVNITLTDTGPVAHNDLDSVGLGATVYGNVMTGAGGVTADTLNVDAPITLTNVVLTQGSLVSSVTVSGVTTITTTNGVLVMYQDGSYSYNLTPPANIVVSTPTSTTSFTSKGFGLYGFESASPYSGPNLNLASLNGTSAARVSFSTGGIGPDDNLSPSSNDSRIESGEELVISLPVATKVASIEVNNLGSGEVALWEAYNAAGTLVNSGSWPGNGVQSFDITAGVPFNYVVVRSGAGSSDEFRVTGISITPEPTSIPDVFTYTIADSDGSSSSATLTMQYDSTTMAVNDIATVFEAGINQNGAQHGGTLATSNVEIATGNILANDTGVAGSTVITVSGQPADVNGVITITDARGTVQLYTQNYGTFVKGDYVVTLTGGTTEGVNDTISLNYTLTTAGQASNATLTVNIVDDVPTVQDSIVQVRQGALPDTNLVFVIDVSGSMAGEVKNVASDGTVTIMNRLDATKLAVAAVINEYFSQGGNISVKLVSFSGAATLLNGGVAYTNANDAIAAVNGLSQGGSTNYQAALQMAMNAFTMDGAVNTAENNTVYFISDGVPTAGDTTDPGASIASGGNGYRDFINTNGIKSYAVGIASDISDPSELNNIHNVDSDVSGVKDAAIIVTNVATLDEVLLASVPTSFGGSVAGTAANSSLNFGADGGYISSLVMKLDTNGDSIPDTDVTFTYNTGTNQISVVGPFPATGFPIAGDSITLNAGNGFADGVLIFNFTTGEYVYQTAGFATEGEQFDIKFTATDGDGDVVAGKQTIQIVDAKPHAMNDIDTLMGNSTFFEGNVMSAIGTDGGDSLQLTSFSTGRSGEDDPGDNGNISSIVFKGVTFDLTTLVGPTAALGGTYQVSDLAGVKTLTWTAASGGSSLVFNEDGYYKYTPPTAEISINTTGASTSYALTSAALLNTAATAGMTLAGIARTSAAEGSAAINTPNSDGVGVVGNTSTRIDNLESLVINFDASKHPHGVQGVSIFVDTSNSNLGGTDAFNYSIYNIHGDLIGQFASNQEGNVAIPASYTGIGKIVIDSGGTGSYAGAYGSISAVTYASILDTPGSAAPAPEVITYTITDIDGDTSSATLTLNNIIDDIAGTSVNNTITGSARNEYISGLGGDDIIDAGAGFDIVRGGDGNDVIGGGADDDQLYGEAGNDVISGGTGNDLIYGDEGDDALLGNDGADKIYGGIGNDIIDGGAGADTIVGGAGNDILTGGLGSDTFKWELADKGTVGLPATDIVTDFNVAPVSLGGDVLDLRDLLVGEHHDVGAGNLANYLHFEKSGSDTVIHVSSNGDFSAGFNVAKDVQIITLQNVDLVGSFTNDHDIVQNLLANQKLITD